MFKEKIHSVIDSPNFLPWDTENWFDEEGSFHSRSIFLTRISLKRGTSQKFTQELIENKNSNVLSYLEFYSPQGSLMMAEIRGFLTINSSSGATDYLDLLVTLSNDQAIAIFPDRFMVEDIGY